MTKTTETKKIPFEKLKMTSVFLPILDLRVIECLLIDPNCQFLNRSEIIRQAIRKFISHEIDVDLAIQKFVDIPDEKKLLQYLQNIENELNESKQLD